MIETCWPANNNSLPMPTRRALSQNKKKITVVSAKTEEERLNQKKDSKKFINEVPKNIDN